MRLLVEAWATCGFLTYVLDPFNVIHGNYNPRLERFLILFLCLVGWPLCWAITAVEWYMGTRWE